MLQVRLPKQSEDVQMDASQALDEVVGPISAALSDGTEYRQALSTPSSEETCATPDGRIWVAVHEGLVNGQVTPTPASVEWKGRNSPAVADNCTLLEQCMGLGSRVIEATAKSVQFQPAAQGTMVAILRGLAAAARKLTLQFSGATQSLSAQNREAVVSALDKSGVASTLNLLSPLLRLDAASSPCPCLALHEFAKFLYTTAKIFGWQANEGFLSADIPLTLLAMTAEQSGPSAGLRCPAL
jgi:hypothetical protein